MEKIRIAVGNTLVFQLQLHGPSDNLDLNFYDSTRRNAVFHLVYRKFQHKLVFNTLENGLWGSEEAHHWSAGQRSKALLQLTFHETHITVRLDDKAFDFELRDEHFSEDITYLLHAADVREYCQIIDGQQVFWSSREHEQTLADGNTRLKISPIKRFTLGGSLLPAPDLQHEIKLICNGKIVEASVVTQLGNDGSQLDFQIELPGVLWSQGEVGQTYLLQLCIDGETCPEFPFALTAHNTLDWFEEIAGEGLGNDCYWPLLAIEHWHFLRSSLAIEAWVSDFLQQAAREYKLEAYLADDRELQVEDTTIADRFAVPLDVQLKRNALEEFNRKLPLFQGREDELLASLCNDSRLNRERQIYIVESLAHYFMAIGRFEAIRYRLPSAHIQEMANTGSAWGTSLSIPFLVAEGHIEQATSTLERLRSFSDWIETASIETACKLVSEGIHRLFRRDECERFCYALIALLDHLRTDYWSRLHDKHLIAVLVHWLHKHEYWQEWLTKDLEAAALRCYGMSPTFWEMLSAGGDNDIQSLAQLSQGQQCFERLQKHLRSFSCWSKADGKKMRPEDAEILHALRSDLAFFRSHGNDEAQAALREVAANLLQTSTTQRPSHGITSMLLELAQSSPAEALRIVASPFQADDATARQLPRLEYFLRMQHAEVKHSTLYLLQKKAWRILLACQEKPNRQQLELLIEIAGGLVDTTSKGLGINLLASAWSVCSPELSSDIGLEHQLGDLVAQACNTSVGDAYAPQALMATRATLLRALQQGRHSTQAEQIIKAIERHFPCPPLPQISLSSPLPRCRGINDTLVVVYSCRAYLDTRIVAIRETWLRSLASRGIPYVVMVGDGNDELSGDLLSLNVSDRYEDLPRKTLKFVEWVLENTDFEYVLKIDDDCYLNVEEYFDSASYRKFHYYGRVLHRHKGAMDRAWHHSKSQGMRAMSALDKSPEPSTYADGGGAYSLSRFAMQSLIDASRSPEGKRLIASSFMEDKLVGDLLAGKGIGPDNEDYYTLVRRRLFRDATPINIWDNNFYPSRQAPCKLAHLDTDRHMYTALAHQQDDVLWPKKLWASYETPKIGLNSNQLELISSREKTQALLTHDLVVVAVMRNEKIMLPHFLDHYRKLGVQSFIVIDNCSDDGSREFLERQEDVILYSADTEYRYSHYGVVWQQAVLANHCLGKWVLLADADELLVYPGHEEKPLTEITQSLEAGAYDAACILMVDMYPFGQLTDADFERETPFAVANWFDHEALRPWALSRGRYSTTLNFTSALRHRLMPDAEPHAFTSQKYCLLKYAPWVRLCEGLHDTGEIRPSPEPMWFAHFKYHAGFKEKVETEVRRNQHFNGAEEYRKYRALLAESSGQFGIEEHSVRYENSHSFEKSARG